MADETFLAAIAAEVALVPSDSATAVLEAGGTFDLAAAISKAEAVSPAWVIEIPNVGAVFQALSKQEGLTAFRVPEISTSLFATNQAVDPAKCQVLVRNGLVGLIQQPTPPVPTEDRTITKVFKTGADEERFVLGVVLVPEDADSQGDIYSHHEVRKAAHAYMEHARDLGKQHKEIVTGQLRILESYVAPADFTIGEEKISSGTWLMGIRVADDDLWDEIKKGNFTGFSIGGAAYRKPEVT